MNSFGRIIADLREQAGLSQRALASLLCRQGVQVTNQAISKWENDVTQPSALQFLALCQVLEVSDVMGTFLGSAKGDLLQGLNAEGRTKAKEYIDLLRCSERYQEVTAEILPLRSLPLYHISVSAGTGQFLDSDHYDLVQVGEEVPLAANFGVRIAGDSMEPKLRDGQVVWVHQQQTLEDGEIGIFLYEGNAYCKKLVRTVSGPQLVSLNPAYPPILVQTYSDLRVFGRVIG